MGLRGSGRCKGKGRREGSRKGRAMFPLPLPHLPLSVLVTGQGVLVDLLAFRDTAQDRLRSAPTRSCAIKVPASSKGLPKFISLSKHGEKRGCKSRALGTVVEGSRAGSGEGEPLNRPLRFDFAV